MPDQATDEFLTSDEAAALLGVKPATLYAYASRGVLQSYKQGTRRQRLYRRSELEALRGAPAAEADPNPAELPEASSWVGER